MVYLKPYFTGLRSFVLKKFLRLKKWDCFKRNVIKSRYTYPLIDRAFKTEINRLNHFKPYGPKKCPVLLILPYAGGQITKIIKKNIKKLMEKVYYAAKPRLILLQVLFWVLKVRISYLTYITVGQISRLF